MKTYRIYIVSLLVLALLQSSCRYDHEQNMFDPANSFVRFNYSNDFSADQYRLAKDSISIKSSNMALIPVPIALSAPRQTEQITVQFDMQAQNLTEGVHFILSDKAGNPIQRRHYTLAPGQFADTIWYKPVQQLENTSISFNLTSVSKQGIHLGFPGSTRGQTFKILIKP
jgi:hypothetical protein